MKLFHFALAFMLLLTACSKDDEKSDGKTDESFPCYEGMWTTDEKDIGVIINSADAYVTGDWKFAGHYHTWLDYGKIGSLQDIDIYNIPVISEVDYSKTPIRENHGYIRKVLSAKSYTAFYITRIHRDKDGNILYIKYQKRDFVPYEGWL